MTKPIVEVLALGLIFFLEGAFPLFGGREFPERGRHAARNIGMGLLNAAVAALFFSFVTLEVIRYADWKKWGFLNLFFLPYWAEFILGFALFDLWMYLWHRANHRLPFLWRFHRMHHSDPELDSTSALRFHTGEIVLSSLVRLAVVPLLGMDYLQLLVYEICLQPIIFFHHSNIALPERWDRVFRAVIVTPNMHRVHHSQIVGETNSNYCSIFSAWDRLFRTFRFRQDVEAIRFGLPDMQHESWQTFWGMIKTPFVKVPANPPQI